MRRSRLSLRTFALLAGLAALGAGPACVENSSPGGGGSGGAAGGGGEGGTVLPGPVPITVANWNVRNLFNDVDDSTAEFEEIDPNWPTRRGHVGVVLRALDADVVALQEVENQAVLESLDEVELDDRYPYVAITQGNDPRGINIGFLSKLPIDKVVSHADEFFTKEGTTAPSYRFSRDAVELHLTINGRHVVLVGVHFKAKDNDDPDKRLAEAQQTRKIVDDLLAADPGAGIAVLGDFNDTPGSPPVDAVLGQGPTLLAATDAVPVSDRWTYQFSGNRELVDHHLANPLLAERANPDAARIIHGPEQQTASDHSPVLIGYDLN
ncbi:MAG: endonuclease/exonuclease/phosphatase family protein [Myxococcales bacterium]|nr:endonuclease/exonuclease/phosphatase family protein [Myxococcales bacterium]